MSGTTYLVDSNVLMEAANTYYAFESVPSFWQWMTTQIERGVIRTVSMTGYEIEYPPELVEWFNAQDPARLFVDASDPNIQGAVGSIGQWLISHSSYRPEFTSAFLSKADPWLVAAGSVHGCTVVTQERRTGPGAKEPKVPNVCDQFAVPCINTFEMMRQLKPKL